jgi:hypothetical protein
MRSASSGSGPLPESEFRPFRAKTGEGIRNAGAAAKFDAHFERMWDAAQPMIEFEPAIRALEPK